MSLGFEHWLNRRHRKEPAIWKLKVGYALALSIIALFTFISESITQSIVETQTTSAARVNVGGRQRMLAQEISLYGVQFVDSKDSQEHKRIAEKLDQAIKAMDRNYEGLIKGNLSQHLPSQMSSAVYALYFSQPVELGQQTQEYLAHAKALLQTPESKLSLTNDDLNYILSEREEFVNALNQVVNEYQKESEEKIAQIKAIHRGVMACTILILLIEAIFIFRPLVKKVQNVQETLVDQNTVLHDLSELDSLTGIPNRRTLNSKLEEAFAQGLKGKPLALIMCDIDYFKRYNDSYGHLQGDVCLRQVAKALESVIKRKEDIAARYGGEEFALLLQNTDEQGAFAVAEQARSAVHSLEIEHQSSSVKSYVTISLGVSVMREGGITELIETADRALYQAKEGGRDRVVLHTI